ncbi:MAG: multiheme c-type cytochrome [Phycisphaerae bacterium]
MKFNFNKTTLWKIWFGGLIALSLPGIGCDQTEEYQFVSVEHDQRREVVDPMNKVDMALIFTGSTRGEFEPCGCGGVYEGGFARRATVIDRIKTVNPNLLLLDTGDLTSSASPSQMEFIAHAYHLLQYDALAVGEGDLRVGMEVFNRFAGKYSLPFVASNLKFKSPTPIRQVISFQRGGKKIAVISVIADRWLAILPSDIRDQFTYETPAAALRRLVPKLRPQYDVIILLSHLGPSVRETISENLTGIDLWIDTGGHPWTVNRTSTQPAQAAAAKTPNEMSLFTYRRPPLMISWSNDRKVGIAGLKWQDSKLTISTAEMIPLARGIIEDRRFIEIYDAYKYISRQELINWNRDPLRKSTTQPAAFQYVASEKCGDCHKKIYQFWRTTRHAHAFETLRQDKRDSDLNCWACHTTGFRQPGGFDTPLATPKLVNVGCQDCHQKDLRTHPNPKTISTPAQAVKFQRLKDNLTQAWHCQRCHVPHRSPNFMPGEYIKRIACTQALPKRNKAKF